MTTFESRATRINRKPEELYELFSDLNNIEKFKDKIPEDKINDLKYTTDSFSVSVSPIGRVGFKIVDRQPYENIRFVTENAPVDLHFSLCMQPYLEKETEFRVIAEADLNPFLKPMISKPLQDAVDKMADMFSDIFNQ